MFRKNKGLWIVILSIVFNILESLYFGMGTQRGFNLDPMNIGELICDGISTIIFFIGIWVMGNQFVEKINNIFDETLAIDHEDFNFDEEFKKLIKEID